MAIYSIAECPSCGGGHKSKPFAVYDDGYHCFSCGLHKRAEYNFTAKVKKDCSSFTLPTLEHDPQKFGVVVRKWLVQYHVTDDLIRQHGICEAPEDSVFMPVYIDDKLVRYSRRWLNPRRDHMDGEYYSKPVRHVGSNVIVLVEDFISYIRVGSQYSTCCLFGTNLGNDTLTELLKTYDSIIVWLDNDAGRRDGRNPGQDAAKKIIGRLQNIIYKKFALGNKVVYNVITEHDPKCYTDSEIRSIIDEKLTTVHNTQFNQGDTHY